MAEQKDIEVNKKSPYALKKEAKRAQLMKTLTVFSKKTLTESERAMRKFAIEHLLDKKNLSDIVGFYFRMSNAPNKKYIEIQLLDFHYKYKRTHNWFFRSVDDKFILRDKISGIGMIEINDFLQIILSINDPRPQELIYPIDIDHPKERKHLEKLKHLSEIEDPLAKNFAPDTTKFLKTFGQSQKQKEYMFLFSSNMAIKEFCSCLNNETWKSFSNIRFYNYNSPVELSPDPFQIQKRFKISLHFNPLQFISFYENRKNPTNLHNNTIFLICDYNPDIFAIGHKYKMFKKCLWIFSTTPHKIPDTFFSQNLLLQDHYRRIYNLWMIITYGLGMETEMGTTPPPTSKHWYNFLTQNQYDPRIFLFVDDILGFFESLT